MKRICSVCGKYMGEKPGEGITHGLCPQCESEIREAYGLPQREYHENELEQKQEGAGA